LCGWSGWVGAGLRVGCGVGSGAASDEVEYWGRVREVGFSFGFLVRSGLCVWFPAWCFLFPLFVVLGLRIWCCGGWGVGL